MGEGIGETVAAGEVRISYTIRRWGTDEGGFSYDWLASNGDESDQLHDSIKDAQRDILSRY